jgi:hypothetical protein
MVAKMYEDILVLIFMLQFCYNFCCWFLCDHFLLSFSAIFVCYQFCDHCCSHFYVFISHIVLLLSFPPYFDFPHNITQTEVK